MREKCRSMTTLKTLYVKSDLGSWFQLIAIQSNIYVIIISKKYVKSHKKSTTGT